MTLMGRTLVRSEGYIGAPGYNVLHWTAGVGPGPGDPGGVEEFHDTLEACYSVFAEFVNPEVTFTIEQEVTCFDDSDGVLTAVTVDPTGDRTIVGFGSGFGISRATAICTRLFTAEIVNGRRLQGRVFIGPAAASALDGDGQITSAARAAIDGGFYAAYTGLGGILAVWHRPTFSGTPPVNNNDGAYGDVTGVSSNEIPGTLRSRKS